MGEGSRIVHDTLTQRHLGCTDRLRWTNERTLAAYPTRTGALLVCMHLKQEFEEEEKKTSEIPSI